MHSSAQLQANQLVVSVNDISNSCSSTKVLSEGVPKIPYCPNEVNIAEKVNYHWILNGMRNSMTGYIAAFQSKGFCTKFVWLGIKVAHGLIKQQKVGYNIP